WLTSLSVEEFAVKWRSGKKKSRRLSRRRTNQLCYAVIQKKEVRQYGAQRPSLDVAFTCEKEFAPAVADVY
ncbi:hypothetical protein, partial [Mixta calida]|uniref:hypothetical protein n=1 Tax=Mixta calida TaxID=665913 RepID=UPI0028AD6A79